MSTYYQKLRSGRKPKPYYNRSSHLKHCPQKSGVIEELRIMAPKKPNSAKRKVAKVNLRSGRSTLAHIPGSGHNLQKHSDVLLRFGRRRDLPGVHYWLMRGKLDFSVTQKIDRHNRRSKFSLKQIHKPVDEGPSAITAADLAALKFARFDMAARMLRNRDYADRNRVILFVEQKPDAPVYEDDLGAITEDEIKVWITENAAKTVPIQNPIITPTVTPPNSNEN